MSVSVRCPSPLPIRKKCVKQSPLRNEFTQSAEEEVNGAERLFEKLSQLDHNMNLLSARVEQMNLQMRALMLVLLPDQKKIVSPNRLVKSDEQVRGGARRVLAKNPAQSDRLPHSLHFALRLTLRRDTPLPTSHVRVHRFKGVRTDDLILRCASLSARGG